MPHTIFYLVIAQKLGVIAIGITNRFIFVCLRVRGLNLRFDYIVHTSEKILYQVRKGYAGKGPFCKKGMVA